MSREPKTMRAVALALVAALAAAPVAAHEPAAPMTPRAVHADLEFLARARAAAERIVAAARADARIYEDLVALCDGIGPRPAGSAGYDAAAAWAAETLAADGLVARFEELTLDRWVRGPESAMLLEPGPPRPLAVSGLGRGVPTPEGGVVAPVLVVRDFDELEALGDAARGKIVLFNAPMVADDGSFRGYGAVVRYRWEGPLRASEQGAVAALVRSITTRSLATLHTGAMRAWEPGERAIPAAAVTLEDAEMLQRLQDRGLRATLRLELGAHVEPDVPSANVIGELRGRERPDEVVLIGAHLDSWDLGTGAHDDGAGVVQVMGVLRLLQALELRPRRTVRAVLFANEECGLDGGRAYLEQHRERLRTHVAALESDAGGGPPRGFSFDGSDAAAGVLADLMPLFRALGPLELTRGGSGADIGPIVRRGVPGLGFRPETRGYFDIHHSPADTVDKVDPAALRESLGALALMTWLLAELPEPLARRAPDAAE